MDHVQSWVDAKEVRRLAEGLMDPPPEVDAVEDDTAYGEKFEGFADTSSADAGHSPEEFKLEKSPLAQALKVAEGSGMLRQASQSGSSAASQQMNSEYRQDSPFRVSTHQDMTDDVPMAREVPAPTEPEQVIEEPEVAVQKQPVEKEPVEASAPVEKLISSSGPSVELLQEFSATIREEMGARAMLLLDHDGGVILDEVKNPKLVQVAQTLAQSSRDECRRSDGSVATRNLHVRISTNATLEVMLIGGQSDLLILGVVFNAPLGVERAIQLAEQFKKIVKA